MLRMDDWVQTSHNNYSQGVRPVKLKWSNVDWDDWHYADIPDGKHADFAMLTVGKAGDEYEMDIYLENVRDYKLKAKTLRAAKAEAVTVLRAHVARMVQAINSIEETT